MTEQLQEAAKLIIDGVAASPFEDYPGEIRFDGKMGAKRYRAFMEAIQAQDDDVREGFLSEASYRGLWALDPQVSVSGLVKEFDACEDTRVMRWACEVGLEYIRPFLIDAPWRPKSGVGLMNGAARPG